MNEGITEWTTILFTGKSQVLIAKHKCSTNWED